MQERHEERQATVRLRHNPLDKDYTMQEEWKEEGRTDGTTGKATGWTERSWTKKKFIRKLLARQKGEQHSTWSIHKDNEYEDDQEPLTHTEDSLFFSNFCPDTKDISYSHQHHHANEDALKRRTIDHPPRRHALECMFWRQVRRAPERQRRSQLVAQTTRK